MPMQQHTHNPFADAHTPASIMSTEDEIHLKIAVVGDHAVGKTTLSWAIHDYCQTTRVGKPPRNSQWSQFQFDIPPEHRLGNYNGGIIPYTYKGVDMWLELVDLGGNNMCGSRMQ